VKNSLPSPRTIIYRLIAEQGMRSKADLMSEIDLTGSTLTRLLEDMVADGLLVVSGLGPSNGGRRPILYEINANYGYFFGLDISRRYSALGFFDMNMNPKSFTRWRMDEAMTPEQLCSHVAVNIRSILQDHRIDREQVLGLGIGAVGPLDRMAGRIARPLNFPAKDWKDVPICDLLTEATGIPAYLENGSNAALIGEQWAMRGDKLQHMLYVHAGVGLRSAMMSYGQIVHGTLDMEGSIGQMVIQTDGIRLLDYGNYGALEAYVSVQALEKRARADAKMGRGDLAGLFLGPPDSINYDLLLQALNQGNPYVMELFLQSAAYFGVGLANMINLFHPEAIILGGALVHSHDAFYQTAIKTAIANTFYYPEYQPVFTKGRLREDAVATGAAIAVWKQLLF